MTWNCRTAQSFWKSTCDGAPPAMTLTLESLQQRIADAAGKGTPLEIVAGDTKRGYGHAVAGAEPLDVRGLSGVIDYQPQELICIAGPGTPLAELEALLAER